MFENYIKPNTLGVLTTMKCTAECDECCFECSPYRDDTLKINEIIKIIDSISEEFPTIAVIAWSGGECTLLGDDLFKAINYAKSKGILSRIVSNGWWAISESYAEDYLTRLKRSGLKEINISTGDNHQDYVSFDKAILAAVTAAKIGISSVISVERRASTKFNKDDLLNNKIYKKFIEDNVNTNLLKIIEPVWVSFHSDNIYDYSDLGLSNESGSCDDIFEVISISKDKGLSLCCGITLDYIPSMKIDDFDDFCENASKSKEKYLESFSDFLKLWIYIDGPYAILKKVKEWD